MPARLNELGQPIGAAVPGWTARARPPRSPMAGRYARVEPLAPLRHADDLYAANAAEETTPYAANAADRDGRMWTYMGYGPFADLESYRAHLERQAASADPLFFAILDRADGCAKGIASYLRLDPANGVIEVGHIALSPGLQRTRAATEAMHLMMRRAFDELGYRRYEWKCDDLNAPSRRAAERLGFRYEGTFRQAMVYKGRNRDTAWYAVLDAEWPTLRAAFEAWLDPANFDADGRQRRSLGELRALARPSTADEPPPS